MGMTQTKQQNSKSRFGSVFLTAILAIGGFQIGTALPAVIQVQKTVTEAPSSLELNVSGYAQQTGQIMVALYADEDAFDEEATPYRDAKVRVEGPVTAIIFKNLPVGEYAFKLFHDENGNNQLDTNGLGIPSENYFFSTDASDPFSAPEFDESKFVLPAGKMVRSIDLS